MGLEDDVVYLKILIFTFLASYFVKRAPCFYRALISAILAIVVISVVCGSQIFYSLPMVLVNILMIRCSVTPLVNFVFCFGYLTFFRCAHLICGGGVLPKYLPHANAVQLIMTLRCVGLAFELSDQRNAKKRRVETSGDATEKMVPIIRQELSNSCLQMFMYCYNLFGLFTGPYYSYRVHQDMVRCKYLQEIPCLSEVITRLMAVPLLIIAFLVLQTLCPLEDAHKDSFFESNTILLFLFYPIPVFACLRMRVYIAWKLSEASCIVAGLGAYPKASKPKVGAGPTDLRAYQQCKEEIADGKSPSEIECDYETISNIGVYGCDFGLTFRDSMRYWNRSVQYWLATIIYRRCPCKSMRTAITMLVSAYWHGINAGYYLSFLSIPLCLFAEDLAFNVMETDEDRIHPGIDRSRFRLFWCFLRMRGFEYMAMGFLLLSWKSTIRYWTSTFYWYHVALVIMIVAFTIKKHFSTKAKRD